jgi:fructose-1,6-bisphosphatase/inositol monophosphatase family enzyme
MSEEMTKLHELITSVRLDIRELNTKMDNLKDLTEKVEKVDSVATQALQSSNVADKRLNAIEDNQKWLWRTVAAGLILGAIGMFFKLKLGV